MEVQTKKQAIAGNLRALDIAESISFPMYRTMVVRQSIINLQTITSLRFTTSTNRQDETITVTRIQ